MVDVDGSDGGGQIVRTSLSLSMLTGEPVHLTGIRGDRPDPGLAAQHLTAVETAAAVCDADVSGAERGATKLTFDPGEPTGGTYEAAIGTAGSLTLLFDALLPVATRLERPLELTATGGTDVKWSPPMAFSRRVKLPLLRDRGLAAVVEPGRPGFYPAGGGRATLRLWPSSPTEISLTRAADDPSDLRACVYSLAAEQPDDADVAARQAEAAAAELHDMGLETAVNSATVAAADSPGSSLVVGLERSATSPEREGPVAGFDAYGEQGTPAEAVAAEAVAGVSGFLETDAAVDAHLADQLLVWLAVAGGRVAIPRVTDHVETSLGVFDAFGYDLSISERSGPPVVVAR